MALSTQKQAASSVLVTLMRLLLSFLALSAIAFAKSPYPEKTPDTPGNKLLDRYFAGEARTIAE